MFTFSTNLANLHTMDTIYIDGTFKSCLKQFTQFFIIHGLKESNNYVPLVFYLLPNKEKKLMNLPSIFDNRM